MPNDAAHLTQRSLQLRLFSIVFVSVSRDILLATCAAELAGSTLTRSMLWKKSIEKMI